MREGDHEEDSPLIAVGEAPESSRRGGGHAVLAKFVVCSVLASLVVVGLLAWTGDSSPKSPGNADNSHAAALPASPTPPPTAAATNFTSLSPTPQPCTYTPWLPEHTSPGALPRINFFASATAYYEPSLIFFAYSALRAHNMPFINECTNRTRVWTWPCTGFTRSNRVHPVSKSLVEFNVENITAFQERFAGPLQSLREHFGPDTIKFSLLPRVRDLAPPCHSYPKCTWINSMRFLVNPRYLAKYTVIMDVDAFVLEDLEDWNVQRMQHFNLSWSGSYWPPSQIAAYVSFLDSESYFTPHLLEIQKQILCSNKPVSDQGMLKDMRMRAFGHLPDPVYAIPDATVPKLQQVVDSGEYDQFREFRLFSLHMSYTRESQHAVEHTVEPEFRSFMDVTAHPHFQELLEHPELCKRYIHTWESMHCRTPPDYIIGGGAPLCRDLTGSGTLHLKCLWKMAPL